MPTPQELEDKFWSALASDRTVMLGLEAWPEGLLRPMAGQRDGERRAIWFFTSRETELCRRVQGPSAALLAFAARGHGVFASLRGTLDVEEDHAVLDRLWSRWVAAWFEGGKEDPNLVLLRFDPSEGEIWEDGSSLLAGIKLLLGADPKEDYRDQVARVDFRAPPLRA